MVGRRPSLGFPDPVRAGRRPALGANAADDLGGVHELAAEAALESDSEPEGHESECCVGDSNAVPEI